jgi:hypothetical protein
MHRQTAFLLVVLIGLASLSGCANARYVQVDQETGVVAMPANTNCWPTYYRDHAEALMRQKCPNGYEVVCEEESVVGQVAHTHTESETRPPPSVSIGGVASVAVPLGNTEERTRETTNVDNVTEWRIYYHARQPGPPAPRS